LSEAKPSDHGGPQARRQSREREQDAREGSPLAGRGVLVTGVSRRIGIGWAIARRLGEMGADLYVSGWRAHDAAQPWGEDPGDPVAELRAELPGTAVHAGEHDFADPGAPERCVAEAAATLGHVDVLVANHAHSSNRALGELDAAELDRAFAVNVRATLLLIQAFVARHDGRPGGRVIYMTSGQYRGPMPGELPYIAGKAALHGLTASLAAALAPRGITVNCVDPGATDTGYAPPDAHAAVLAEEPMGRWGEPDDAARLIAFLASDAGRWITGQVIASTGGGP
jgi:3-oxoacyl-[acyl-carrier protein] reductase